MSKNIQNEAVKSSKKIIHQRLTDELKAIIKELGLEPEKLTDDVEKATKKLAKIIAKELKPGQSAKQDSGKEDKAAITTKTTVPKQQRKKVATTPEPVAVAKGKTTAKKGGTKPVQAKTTKETSAKIQIEKDGKVS